MRIKNCNETVSITPQNENAKALLRTLKEDAELIGQALRGFHDSL